MRTLALLLALVVIAPAAASAGPDKTAQARIDAAAKAYASALTRWKAGQATVDQVAGWSVRWLTALREQPQKGTKLKVALTNHLGRMKDLDAAVADAVKAGIATTFDAEAAAYYFVEAQVWAARGK